MEINLINGALKAGDPERDIPDHVRVIGWISDTVGVNLSHPTLTGEDD